MKVVETCQDQRDIIYAEEIKDTYNLNLDNQVDKDVFLFEGKFHKRVKKLVKRKNVHSGQKQKKVEYEDSFKRLESLQIDNFEEKKHLTTQSICISRRNVCKKLQVIPNLSMNSPKTFILRNMI